MFVPTAQSCNKRFHPQGRTDEYYWFFCRLEPGHAGRCDCPSAYEDLKNS